MGRTKRTLRSLGLAGGAGLLAAALIAPSVSAAPAGVNTVTDTIGGSASGRALDLKLLGRQVTLGAASAETSLDAVASKLTAQASGLGTALSPKTNVTAILGGAQPDRSCAIPPLSSILGQVDAILPDVLKSALPALELSVACGAASATGSIDAFNVLGTGSVAKLSVALSPAVQGLIGSLQETLNSQILSTPIGTLLESADSQAQAAVGQLNGLLGQVLGTAAIKLPVLDLTNTVQDLLTRLQKADLVRFAIGDAEAKNVGDAGSFIASATDKGGVIEIMPEFRGANSAPLVRISTALSGAEVSVNRATAAATGKATNTLVRIESELLPEIPLGQLGVAGVTPLADLVEKLGYKSGPGFLELSPGQSVTLFPGTPLESEISVGMPKETKLDNGRLRIESAAVSVHLLKGLDSLPVVGNVGLGTILANPTVDAALAPLTQAAGLSLGETTSVPGIKLDLAHSVAEAGAVKVLGSQIEAPRSLPRTGGTPVDAAPYAVPMLLGSAGGLRMLMRRRRNG